MWQVLIVEDDPETRAFFARSIGQCAELSVWALADSVAAAKARLLQAADSPDVMLVDLGLPDGSGLDLLHWVRAKVPNCESLVISMFGDESHVLASVEAGALGYIHKDSTPDDIAKTVLELKAGESPISPMIARRLLREFQEKGARETTVSRPLPQEPSPTLAKQSVPGSKLSTKEREVLDLIARGFSYAEIARLRGVTVHTIQSHIKNLYGKLAVHSRSEAVFEASRLGLLDDTFGNQ